MVRELAPEYTPNVEWWREHAKRFLSAGTYQAFVAEDGGRIVGFLDGFIFPEPSTGKLHGVGQHFYVLPEYRGTSAAGLLYRHLLKTARESGCQVIELFCFDREKSFWLKKGYKPVRSMVRREI